MSEIIKRATDAAFAEIERQCLESGWSVPDDFTEAGDRSNVLIYGANLDLRNVIRAAIEAMREPRK